MSSRKPVIGIVMKQLTKEECPESLCHEDYVKDEFRDVIIRAGGLPIGVLPPFHTAKFNPDESDIVFENNLTEAEMEDFHAVLDMCDGFILQGGLTADFYEYYIAKHAIENNIPVLGTCAGFNSVIRAAGCNITTAKGLGLEAEPHNIADLDYRHDVDVAEGTLIHELYKTDKLAVNSLHTKYLDRRTVDETGERLVINATIQNTLPDGTVIETVEAITVKDTKFAIGTKWHPELMEDEHKLRLFERFVEECRK